MKVTVPCQFCGTLNRVDLGRLDSGPRCAECSRPILLDRPIKITDESFERVIQDAEAPVIVDFYADWCGPCKIMAPLFDELAAARSGGVLVAKVDTDRSPATSMKYGIRSIPTLILFRGGKEVARQVGAVPRAALDALVGPA